MSLLPSGWGSIPSWRRYCGSVYTSLTALAITANKAWFAGVSTERRPFLAYVEDNGPGSRDVFKLWIAGLEQTGTGALKQGDLSVLGK